MKEDSDQKERCNKKAEGKFGFFEDCQSDTTSKKAKKRSLYKQNIFCSSKLFKIVFTLLSIPWLQSHSIRYREPSIPNDRAT